MIPNLVELLQKNKLYFSAVEKKIVLGLNDGSYLGR